MATVHLTDAATIKQRLYDVPGIPANRRPTSLSDPIILAYIGEESAIVLGRLGRSDAPTAGTTEADGATGATIDLVLIRIKRDFFGLDGVTMQALNTQYQNTLRKLDDLVTGAESSRTAGLQVWGGE